LITQDSNPHKENKSPEKPENSTYSRKNAFVRRPAAQVQRNLISCKQLDFRRYGESPYKDHYLILAGILHKNAALFGLFPAATPLERHCEAPFPASAPKLFSAQARHGE
jgi:hypothetical protein